jgi:hypothetical protein
LLDGNLHGDRLAGDAQKAESERALLTGGRCIAPEELSPFRVKGEGGLF